MKTGILLALLILLSCAPASAYILWLDFDKDHNPATIQDATSATEDSVALHIWPDYAGEVVNYVLADMGGSCSDCNDWPNIVMLVDSEIFHSYQDCPTGTAFGNISLGLVDIMPECDASGLTRPFRFMTDSTGPHTLTGPLTLWRFTARMLDHEGTPCPDRPRRLSVATADYSAVIHSITFRPGQTPVDEGTWGQLKTLYR